MRWCLVISVCVMNSMISVSLIVLMNKLKFEIVLNRLGLVLSVIIIEVSMISMICILVGLVVR